MTEEQAAEQMVAEEKDGGGEDNLKNLDTRGQLEEYDSRMTMIGRRQL